MRLKQFDLNLFVVFEAIYSENNLTRAGEVLHLAQPTVSNALTKLREAYDDPLFVRSGRGVAPTPLAHRLIGPVRQSLRLMEGSLEGNLAFDPALAERTFRISIGEVAASFIMPGVVEALGEQAPLINVHAFQMDRREIPGALAAGHLDLAVDIRQLPGKTLNRVRLPEADYVCVLRKEHPLCQQNMNLALFLSLKHIVVSSRPKGASFVELCLHRIDEKITPKVRMQHYLPALKILNATDYALALPRTLAEQFDVVIKELPFAQDGPGSLLYWHRNVEQDPANRWFRALITGLYSPEPGEQD